MHARSGARARGRRSPRPRSAAAVAMRTLKRRSARTRASARSKRRSEDQDGCFRPERSRSIPRMEIPIPDVDRGLRARRAMAPERSWRCQRHDDARLTNSPPHVWAADRCKSSLRKIRRPIANQFPKNRSPMKASRSSSGLHRWVGHSDVAKQKRCIFDWLELKKASAKNAIHLPSCATGSFQPSTLLGRTVSRCVHLDDGSLATIPAESILPVELPHAVARTTKTSDQLMAAIPPLANALEMSGWE